MAENSKISWCDHTFSPWMGCTKVSVGCENCFAESLVTRRMGYDVWGPRKPRHITGRANWRKPYAWDKRAGESGVRARVFCASLCDVFEKRPDLVKPRALLWEVIRGTPSLDWLLLTKRPECIVSMLPRDWDDGWRNVWLGTSVEGLSAAHRIDTLSKVPAYLRFLSYEPALGPLDGISLRGISWVVYGAESGKDRRNENKQWARDMRDLCAAEDVAFWHKQSSAFKPGQGVELDGVIHQDFPKEAAAP